MEEPKYERTLISGTRERSFPSDTDTRRNQIFAREILSLALVRSYHSWRADDKSSPFEFSYLSQSPNVMNSSPRGFHPDNESLDITHFGIVA